MTGRRRRGSTSSLEDQAAAKAPVHWRQETSVLRRIPPETPEDEWPIFELADAVILNRDGKTIVNALDILYKGPFIVRGTLVVEPDQRGHLIMKVGSRVPIEITNCTRYSVGEAVGEQEDEDIDPKKRSNIPVLWMEGRNTWFEISPSPEYRPIYRSICDAIRLYYAVLDVYVNLSSKAINRHSKSSDPIKRLSPIFFQYSVKVGNGMTLAEVVKLCREVAPFLINQFLAGADMDVVHWPDTFFYKWIKKENPMYWSKAEERIRNPKATPLADDVATADQSTVPEPLDLPTRTRSTRSRSTASVAHETPEAPSGQRQRATRSRSSLQPPEEQPAVPPAPVAPSATAPPAAAAPPATAPPTTAASTLATPSSNTPQQVPSPDPGSMSAFETVLMAVESAYDGVVNTKTGVSQVGLLNRIYFSNRVPTYKTSTPGSHRIPVEEILHYNAAELLKKLDPARWADKEPYKWLQNKANEAFQPVALKPSDFPYKVVPRASRPFVPRAAAPATPSSVTAGHAVSFTDDDDGSSVSTGRVGKGIKTPARAGKSSLRPISSTKKRPYTDMDLDDEDDDAYGSDNGAPAKKSHFFQSGDEADDDDDDSDSDADDTATDDMVKIVLRADKIPSTVPHGPNETWTCDQDDCDYMVRGGDAAECQERIRRHFEDHEHQTERVQLAMTEGRAGHLPINHLLDKIKTLGEDQQNSETLSINGVPLPKPIRKKVIV